ncbi:unnamed protein product [Moneuplotes crassus]|uniref:Transmembrane protein n=1 Tax=Euplotes crassus TaxID=5936 RepID=A0AAD2D2L1_EUPCR|nr:unnamed protein product [Moneuplotes crassus]
MRIGRAAAISNAVRHNRENRKRRERIKFTAPKPDAENKQESQDDNNTSQDDYMIDIEDINLQEGSDRKIVFRKYPFAMWIIGTFILILAIYCLYHITLGFLGTVVDGYKDASWWQVLVILALFGLSGVFFFAAKIETVTFDKTKDEFSRKKLNTFCIKKGKEYKLSDISDIRIEKRVHDNVHTNTIHFKIIIDFKNNESVNLLESRKEDKVIRQVLFIKRFLGMIDTQFGNNAHIDNAMDIL